MFFWAWYKFFSADNDPRIYVCITTYHAAAIHQNTKIQCTVKVKNQMYFSVLLLGISFLFLSFFLFSFRYTLRFTGVPAPQTVYTSARYCNWYVLHESLYVYIYSRSWLWFLQSCSLCLCVIIFLSLRRFIRWIDRLAHVYSYKPL